MSDTEPVTDVTRRARALLGVSDDPDAAPAEVTPPASAVGADGAVAFGWPDGVVATVYVLGTLVDARAAQAVLAASTAPPQTAVNGGLLLQVTAPADDAEAAGRARRLVSRFAGRE